jgi:uncharacterized membrane protein
MNNELWLLIFTVIVAILSIPTYIGNVLSFLQWNKERKLKSLEKKLQHYKMLKNDSDYFIRWVAQGILFVLASIAAALLFEGIAETSSGKINLAAILIPCMAIIAYFIAIYYSGLVHRLKDYEKTIKSLTDSITNLKRQ